MFRELIRILYSTNITKSAVVNVTGCIKFVMLLGHQQLTLSKVTRREHGIDIPQICSKHKGLHSLIVHGYDTRLTKTQCINCNLDVLSIELIGNKVFCVVRNSLG